MTWQILWTMYSLNYLKSGTTKRTLTSHLTASVIRVITRYGGNALFAVMSGKQELITEPEKILTALSAQKDLQNLM